MTVQAVLSITIPAFVAVVIGVLGYRQAVKVAARNAKSQSEQLNLQTFTELNTALNKEIDRVRSDREEDQERAARELAKVVERLAENKKACDDLGQKLLKVEAWADAIIRILQHPAVSSAILEHGLIIPPPPIE